MAGPLYGHYRYHFSHSVLFATDRNEIINTSIIVLAYLGTFVLYHTHSLISFSKSDRWNAR
jgi:hypothetical protein